MRTCSNAGIIARLQNPPTTFPELITRNFYCKKTAFYEEKDILRNSD